MDDQNVYHHTIPAKPTFNVKVEKNSRGTNFEFTVVGASSVEEALYLINQAYERLKLNYEEG